MSFTHLLLALSVVIIWGVNFIFVKLGLEEFSPLLLCTLRFTLASIPAIFFIKRPAIPFKMVAAYGLIMFAMQFSLVFIGMYVGMTPGMASLLMQVQIFFSMFFAAVLLGEVPFLWQIGGALIAFSGIGLVAIHFDSNITLAGFLCLLGAAAAWGVGNLITKFAKNTNMMALVVWGSFVAILPTAILSVIFEGPGSIVYTYHHISWLGISSLLYIVYMSTWVGYCIWGWLIKRYPIGTVVPFTLLIPIVGLLSSVLILGEPLQLWKIIAGLLVIGGLCINLLGARFFVKKESNI